MVKAKIIASFLDEALEVVVWRVVLPDNKEADIVMPVDEFGPSIGIYQKIPEKMLHAELLKFVGKEVNVNIGGEDEG